MPGSGRSSTPMRSSTARYSRFVMSCTSIVVTTVMTAPRCSGSRRAQQSDTERDHADDEADRADVCKVDDAVGALSVGTDDGQEVSNRQQQRGERERGPDDLLPTVGQICVIDKDERNQRQDEQDPCVGMPSAPQVSAQGVLVVGRLAGDPMPQQAGATEDDRREDDEEDACSPEAVVRHG